MHNDNDVVVVSGARTPFTRMNSILGEVPAVQIGAHAMREAIERAGIAGDEIDEVIVGNIAGPPDAANVARVIALTAKIPRAVPAHTVNRNCASGLQSIIDGAYRIQAGHADVIVAGAVESMSQIPFLYRRDSQQIFTQMARARSMGARLSAMAQFRPKHFKPIIGLMMGLTDPVSELNMGETAEVLARDYDISREEQDRFALRSHQLAEAAWKEGRMDAEVTPFPVPPKFKKVADRDDGIRAGQTMEALAKLRPAFDRKFGSVTAGNSSQITDGAAAVVLASRRKARESGLPILGQIKSWGFAGCDPSRMGLGPVLATPLALKRAGGLDLDRMELIEINEAFAVQVLACNRAMASREFFEKYLGTAPLGEMDMDRVNVNGGAIALGHPVGATGARLVLTLLHEMARRDQSLGLATLCVGGGQGGAIVVERS